MATNEEMKAEYDIMGATWMLFKKYYDTKIETKEDWESVMNEVYEIEKRFNSKLCNDILIAYVMELERKTQKG